jgi:hypothetical protein
MLPGNLREITVAEKGCINKEKVEKFVPGLEF